MFKNQIVNKYNLNLLIVILSSLLLFSCGKKEGTPDNKTDGKTDTKTDTKKTSDDVSSDRSFLVEFDMKGGPRLAKVTAIYYKNMARTTTEFEAGGVKMQANAYVPGDGFVYVVSEFGGMKTGIKWDKNKFAEQSGKKEGQFDINNWKDKLKEMNKIGSEEILGRQCDIYEAPDKKYKISLYKETVPLKFYMGDKMTMEATKFDPEYKAGEDIFAAPKDVKYSDGSEMLKGMQNMKDPKNIEGMKDKMKEMEDAMKKYNK